jgi:hypothetical protein
VKKFNQLQVNTIYLALPASRSREVGARHVRRGHGTHSRRAIRPLNNTLGASNNSAPTAEREGGWRGGGWGEGGGKKNKREQVGGAGRD